MPARGRLEGLQSLRFVATALVIWAHLKFAAGPVESPWISTAAGAVGVDLFFVISGFVIALAAAKLDRNYRLFFAHRVARVVPLYYLLSLYFVVIAVRSSGSIDFPQLWNSVFFVPFLDVGKFSGTYHEYGWTLSFEMWFYLIFGGILAWKGSTRSRLLTPSILFIGVLLTGFFPQSRWVLPGFGFHPMVLEFCSGILLYQFRAHLKGAVMLALLLALPLFAYGVAVTERLGWHVDVLASPFLGFSRALIWGGFAFCLVGSVVGSEQSGKLKLPRWSVILGDASYSIYLIQPFALRAAFKFFSPAGPRCELAFAAGTLGGGLATYYLIERPLSQRLRPFFEKLFRAKREPGAAPSDSALQAGLPVERGG